MLTTWRFPTTTLTLFALQAMLLFVVACTPSATLRPPRPLPSGPPPDAATALERYRQFDAGLTGARGTCSSLLRMPAGEYDFNQAFLIEQPDKMRMEVFTFMGITLSYLATAEGKYAVYLPGENKFLRGNTDSLKMSGMAMPIFLDLSQLMQLLLGRMPLADYARAELTYDDSDNRYTVTTFSTFGETVQVLHLDPTAFYLLGAEIYEGGVKVGQIELYERDLTAEFKPARKIEADFPLTGTFLRMIVDDLEPNPTIEEELFTLKPPPGVEIIER